MKRASYRTWVLLLGVAVAMAISVAAVLYHEASSASGSIVPAPTPQKSGAASHSAVAIKKVLEKMDWKFLQTK